MTAPARGPLAVVAAGALAAAACASDPTTTCDATPDFTANAPATATASEVKPILEENCALGGCHLSAPGAGALVLAVHTSAWVDGLVGVPACEDPAMDLIAAGDPDGSWLVHKIFGDLCASASACDPATGCGAEMPFGGSLSDADRGVIVAWVVAGATSD